MNYNLPKSFTVVSLFLVFLAHADLYAEAEVEQVIGTKEYMNNCAICHGDDGRGAGPKAKQLSAKPSDLTILSKENGGSFPETAVYNIIDGRRVGDYHGQEMPIWGQHFKDIDADEEVVDERISNLLEYLKSIQVE